MRHRDGGSSSERASRRAVVAAVTRGPDAPPHPTRGATRSTRIEWRKRPADAHGRPAHEEVGRDGAHTRNH
jgi:hypothetical protein